MYPNQVEKFCGRLFLHLRPLRRRVTHTGCDISNTFFFLVVVKFWCRGDFAHWSLSIQGLVGVVLWWRLGVYLVIHNTWSFCLYISKSTSHTLIDCITNFGLPNLSVSYLWPDLRVSVLAANFSKFSYPIAFKATTRLNFRTLPPSYLELSIGVLLWRHLGCGKVTSK